MVDLFIKYLKGNVTKKELDEFLTLVNSKSNNALLNREMRREWKRMPKDEKPTKKQKIILEHILDRVHHKINIKEQPKPVKHNIILILTKVAAILFIPLLIAVLYNGIFDNYITTEYAENKIPTTTISVPFGAISTLLLPDGSTVWLNSGSSMTYPTSFKGQDFRRIELQGEFYFKVAKNETKPFVINTNSIDVKVLGTEFNIRAYSDETKSFVALYEGQVSLGKLNGDEFKECLKLNKEEAANYDILSNSITKMSDAEFAKHKAWLYGRTVFNDDPIEIVINKFEKLFNAEIEIADQEITTYSFTATFVNETLERALLILSQSSPISYKIIPASTDQNGVLGKRKVILSKKTI